jgi:hypothetical protein
MIVEIGAAPDRESVGFYSGLIVSLPALCVEVIGLINCLVEGNSGLVLQLCYHHAR